MGLSWYPSLHQSKKKKEKSFRCIIYAMFRKHWVHELHDLLSNIFTLFGHFYPRTAYEFSSNQLQHKDTELTSTYIRLHAENSMYIVLRPLSKPHTRTHKHTHHNPSSGLNTADTMTMVRVDLFRISLWAHTLSKSVFSSFFKEQKEG